MIADMVYNDLFFSILNYFAISRCANRFTIKIGHKACHTGKHESRYKQYIEASGGYMMPGLRQICSTVEAKL